MTNFPHGAFVAAHAAQEKRRKDEEEEEEMTNYSTEDLASNWEFKIVRSESGAFRKPEVFQNLLEEESIAGWELVEKLDNRRVRFKRNTSARRKDGMLPPGIDPYRTNYGSSAARPMILLGVVIAIALAVGLGVLGFTADQSAEPIAILPVLIVVAVGVVAAALAFIRRR
jgi:hypothetical protein